MRILRILAAALLALPIAATAQEPAPQTLSQRLRAACGMIDRVDRAKLPAVGELPAADYHEEVRTRRPGPGADARRVIRIVIGYSGPGPTPRDSLWARQGPDGTWHVSRAHHSAGQSGAMQIPWPHDAADLSGLPASDWRLVEGQLPAEARRDLEALLESDCLEREPVVRPLSLPEQGGPTRDCNWHPTIVRMELIEGDRTRRYVRMCNSYQGDGDWSNLSWVSDMVVNTLARATLTQSEAPQPQEAATIPEAFRGRWGQNGDGCPSPHLEIGENGFVYEGRLHNRLRMATLRSPRTLIAAGDGPGLLHDVPIPNFELPLMLSPDLERLAIPPINGAPVLYFFKRCR